MTMLHDSADLAVEVGTEPTRFRAPTIEGALADARAELGPDVEILEANRIRRGGVGGFFATELGVEITVQAPSMRGVSDARRLRSSTDDAHGQYLDAEYIDSASLGPAPIAPTSIGPVQASQSDVTRSLPSLVATGETQFYDQQVVEHADDAPMSTDIEQLAQAITDRERTAHRPVDRSFAAHLARELGQPAVEAVTRPIVRSLPQREAATEAAQRPSAADVRARAAESRAAAAATAASAADPTTDDVTRRTGDTATRPTGANESTATAERPVATPDRTIATAEPDADIATAQSTSAGCSRSTTASERNVVADMPGAGDASDTIAALLAQAAHQSSGDERTSATPATGPNDIRNVTPSAPASDAPATGLRVKPAHDVMRRQVDLAAGAVGRLVEQLSDVAPVEGSRMRSLSTLTVKVTTPDGTVIEMAAEMDRSGHG